MTREFFNPTMSTSPMEETEARKRIANIKTLFDARLFIPQGYRSNEQKVKMLAWLVQQEVNDFEEAPRGNQETHRTLETIRSLATISLGDAMALHC